MTHGIATGDMVLAMARARICLLRGGRPVPGTSGARSGPLAVHPRTRWSRGANLITARTRAAPEDAIVHLDLRHAVRRRSASAFMALRPSVVRFACSGVRDGPDDRPVRRRHVMAKVSRPEVAASFLSPPPPEMLDALVRQWALSPQEARLAARMPVAEHVTVEADSGGHTDTPPVAALLPAIAVLCDTLTARYGYAEAPRIGSAGGIGTPQAVAAVFAKRPTSRPAAFTRRRSTRVVQIALNLIEGAPVVTRAQ